VETRTDSIPAIEAAQQPLCSSSREKWFALIGFLLVTASAVALFAR